METETMKYLNLRMIPEKLHKDLKMEAAKQGKSMAGLAILLIKRGLNDLKSGR